MQFKLYDSATVGGHLARLSSTVTNPSFRWRTESLLSAGFWLKRFSRRRSFLGDWVRLHSADNNPSYITLSTTTATHVLALCVRTISATTADQLSKLVRRCVQDSPINSVAGKQVTGSVCQRDETQPMRQCNLLDSHDRPSSTLRTGECFQEHTELSNRQWRYAGGRARPRPGKQHSPAWKNSAGTVIASVTPAGTFTGTFRRHFGARCLFAPVSNLSR